MSSQQTDRIRRARNAFLAAAEEAGFEKTSSQFTTGLNMGLRRPSWGAFSVQMSAPDPYGRSDTSFRFSVAERIPWGESGMGIRSVLSLGQVETLSRSPRRVAAFLERVATSRRRRSYEGKLEERDRRRSRRSRRPRQARRSR